MNRFSKKNYNYKKNRKKNTKNIRSNKNKRKFTKRKQNGGAGGPKKSKSITNAGKRILRRASSTLSLPGRRDSLIELLDTPYTKNDLFSLPTNKKGMNSELGKIIRTELGFKKDQQIFSSLFTEKNTEVRTKRMKKYVDIIQRLNKITRKNPKNQTALNDLLKDYRSTRNSVVRVLNRTISKITFPKLPADLLIKYQKQIKNLDSVSQIKFFEDLKKAYDKFFLGNNHIKKMSNKSQENRERGLALASKPKSQSPYYDADNLSVVREAREAIEKNMSEYLDPVLAKPENESESENAYSDPVIAKQNGHSGTYDIGAKDYEDKIIRGSVSSDTSGSSRYSNGYSSGLEYGANAYKDRTIRGSVSSGTSDTSGSSGYSSGNPEYEYNNTNYGFGV